MARRLLEAPELSLGGQAIHKLPSSAQGELSAAFPGLFAWYVVETRPLEAPATRENLLLFAERPSPEAVRYAWKLATHEGSCNLICVVPDGAEELGKHHQEGISIWTAKDLFSHILRLPPDFPARLRDIALIQRPDEFLDTFQERRALVRSLAGVPQSGLNKDVNILQYFREWLGAHRRVSPMLLLGERGLGKSWQSLRLAREAYDLNRDDPWRFGPAFFIKLRELVNVLEQSSAATPVLLDYILTRYRRIELGLGGISGLGALMAIGHTVVCVDGFDEMDLLPTDARVRARLTELLMLLSRKTRFILSCRPGHFTSLEALLSTESWSGATVGQAFEILDLLPYDDVHRWAYIDASAHEIRPILEGLLGDASGRSPLQHALWVCATHPGLLARMKDKILTGVTDARRLVEDAIKSILIEFNIVEGRTREDYQVANGTWVDLSAPRREEVLADIAWYMAERRLNALDLSNLPPRIRLSYQIEDDALQRDLRSQTVLELAPLSSTGEATPTKSLVRFTLRDEDWGYEEPGEVAVAWAYFLARHVVQRMTESGPLGEMPDEVRLRYLGRIRFGPTVAALVSDLLSEKGLTLADIRHRGTNLLRLLAQRGDYRIFSPWYKHLASNLATMQAIDISYAEQLNPWSPEVSAIVRPPRALTGYQFAIVPPVGYKHGEDPFLLGVHEVTNQEYLSFVCGDTPAGADLTVNGREWAVERMTVAAGGSGRELSANRVLSNEYHMFFWLPEGDLRTELRPPPRILGQPVTYVSWFAAAAYCDWLSVVEGLPRFYSSVLRNALGPNNSASPYDDVTHCTFRLPTKEQWTWAARGGHDDVDRAWDLYPYYLPSEDRGKVLAGGPEVKDEQSRQRYLAAQRVMRAILVDPYKQSGDVLHDEPNDFGVAGLIGNVREWCDSSTTEYSSDGGSEPTQRLVLGATGYLGESTFNFDYETPLYPRNTNPDVGFRVARSLGPEEVEVLRKRETVIASLLEES